MSQLHKVTVWRHKGWSHRGEDELRKDSDNVQWYDVLHGQPVLKHNRAEMEGWVAAGVGGQISLYLLVTAGAGV